MFVLAHGPGGGGVQEYGVPCISLASGEDALLMADTQEEESEWEGHICKGGREAVWQHTPW